MEGLAEETEATAAKGNRRDLNNTSIKIAEKYNQQNGQLKNKNVNVPNNIIDQKNRLVGYFEELLNRPVSIDPPNI